MLNILRADLKRLFTAKLFWVAVIILITLSVFLTHQTYENNQYFEHAGYLDHMRPWEEDGFLGFGWYAAIAIALFTGLFIGTEYRENTIRNKLIVGHTRFTVYLSNLIVVCIAAFVMGIGYIAASLAYGLPTIGSFVSPLPQIIMNVLAGFISLLAIASMLTMLSMLVDHKAVGPILCVIVIGVLYVLSTYLGDQLSQTQMDLSGGYPMSAEEIKLIPLITGTKRTVFEFLQNINPLGQLQQISAFEATNLQMMMVYASGLFVLCTGIGMVVFRKKDLR